MLIMHETEFLMYMIGKMDSYLHDFVYYTIICANYKDFNLYESSSGYYKKPHYEY